MSSSFRKVCPQNRPGFSMRVLTCPELQRRIALFLHNTLLNSRRRTAPIQTDRANDPEQNAFVASISRKSRNAATSSTLPGSGMNRLKAVTNSQNHKTSLRKLSPSSKPWWTTSAKLSRSSTKKSSSRNDRRTSARLDDHSTARSCRRAKGQETQSAARDRGSQACALLADRPDGRQTAALFYRRPKSNRCLET